MHFCEQFGVGVRERRRHPPRAEEYEVEGLSLETRGASVVMGPGDRWPTIKVGGAELDYTRYTISQRVGERCRLWVEVVVK